MTTLEIIADLVFGLIKNIKKKEGHYVPLLGLY
jgi:hypothetical protein